MPDDRFVDELLGPSAARLAGIQRWDQLPGLGRANLARIVALLRAESGLAMAEDRDRDELHALARATTRVQALHDASTLHRPVLPRLRNELFRAGDLVQVYVGDSPKRETRRSWVSGRITAVEKAYRPDWDDGSPNGGYFWRSTIETREGVFSDRTPLRCSTTEPRVQLDEDARALRRLRQEDQEYMAIFVVNAWRTFTPLWCQERDLPFDGDAVDVTGWLEALDELD